MTTCQSPSLIGAWLLATCAYDGDGPPFPLLGVLSWGGEGAALFSPLFWSFGVSPRDAERGLRKIPIFFETGWVSSLFWSSTPLSSRHLWVLSIPPNTSAASFTESFTKPGLFLSIPFCITLRALASFSIFSFCSFRSWRTSFHPSAPEGAPKSSFPTFLNFFSINLFYQRIVRRGAGRNSWERVYPRTEVLPQFPEAQPPLSRSRNTRTDRTRSRQHRLRHLCSIRTTWSRSRRGWLLIPHGTPPRQS